MLYTWWPELTPTPSPDLLVNVVISTFCQTAIHFNWEQQFKKVWLAVILHNIIKENTSDDADDYNFFLLKQLAKKKKLKKKIRLRFSYFFFLLYFGGGRIWRGGCIWEQGRNCWCIPDEVPLRVARARVDLKIKKKRLKLCGTCQQLTARATVGRKHWELEIGSNQK